MLHRPRPDGELVWPDRGYKAYPRFRSCRTGGGAGHDRAVCRLPPRHNLEGQIRVTMPPTSLRSYALLTSVLTWRRTLTGGVRRTTRHPGYQHPSVSVNASRKPLAGSRPWPECVKPNSATWTRWIGLLRSQPPRTTWRACQNCWRCRHDRHRQMQVLGRWRIFFSDIWGGSDHHDWRRRVHNRATRMTFSTAY